MSTHTDSPAVPHPLIAEEERLLAAVRERLINQPPAAGASEDDLIEEMSRIQQEMRAAKTEDKAALEQQYDLQGRVLDHLKRSGAGTPACPAGSLH